jgi:hypothetical protein
LLAAECDAGDLISLAQGSRSDFPRRHSVRTASENAAVTPNEAIDAITIAIRREEFMGSLLL